MKTLEKYLFKRYKDYVIKSLRLKSQGYWYVVIEFESILNKFFDYDFSHVNNHYMVKKNEKIIYEYNV